MITFGERFDSKTVEHLTPKLIIPPLGGQERGLYYLYQKKYCRWASFSFWLLAENTGSSV